MLAAENTTVLMMDLSKVFHTCSRSCPQHQQISDNLLHILARKNLSLSRRILHTSSKSIRGRSCPTCPSWPHSRKEDHHRPFQPAADGGLSQRGPECLSNELSKMQKEGILEYHKESFKLLKEE